MQVFMPPDELSIIGRNLFGQPKVGQVFFDSTSPMLVSEVTYQDGQNSLFAALEDMRPVGGSSGQSYIRRSQEVDRVICARPDGERVVFRASDMMTVQANWIIDAPMKVFWNTGVGRKSFNNWGKVLERREWLAAWVRTLVASGGKHGNLTWKVLEHGTMVHLSWRDVHECTLQLGVNCVGAFEAKVSLVNMRPWAGADLLRLVGKQTHELEVAFRQKFPQLE